VIDYLGWLATAVFVGSYFCARPAALMRAQMIGAIMWVVYGISIGATPVVAANLLVFGAAAWTLTRSPVNEETRRTPGRLGPESDVEGMKDVRGSLRRQFRGEES